MQINRRELIKVLGLGSAAVLTGTSFTLANEPDFEKLIKYAIDNNIVCYDSDAKSGEFTTRLIALMKITMRRNGPYLLCRENGEYDYNKKVTMHTLYIPAETKIDLSQINIGDGRIYTENKIYGVNIRRTKDLMELFHKDKTAILPKDDKYIVLGIDKNNIPLIGSF